MRVTQAKHYFWALQLLSTVRLRLRVPGDAKKNKVKLMSPFCVTLQGVCNASLFNSTFRMLLQSKRIGKARKVSFYLLEIVELLKFEFC